MIPESEDVLEQLGESIWAYEEAIAFGRLPLWHRMAVIRLAGGEVVLHSPTRLNDRLTSDIRGLGPVAAIIAPSWWHDLYLKNWLRAFPHATLYGAPTLVKWNPRLPFTDVLTDTAPALWAGELEQCRIEGIGLFLDEVAFYHRASCSLIVADLLFNISEHDARLTRFLASIVIGTYPGCRFAGMYRPFVLDRARFRNSMERIAQWDFDQIVVGHGAVVDDGKRAFLSAFRWLLT